MLNMRNQLDKSSIQPIKVQNLVLYPGQEYGHYEQQNQQYYNDNKHYNNYNNNHNNFLSNLFHQFTNNNNNNQNEQQQQPTPPPPSPPIQTANSNLLNLNSNKNQEGDIRTFSFRPIIDSIFEIPISTLRAVNNLVGRLTGSYQQPAPPEQQQPTKYFANYPFYSQSTPSYYGIQRSADGVQQPKTQFEMLNRLIQTTTEKAMASSTAATQNAITRKSSTKANIVDSQSKSLKSI